jgi:hypothetical protein
VQRRYLPAAARSLEEVEDGLRAGGVDAGIGDLALVGSSGEELPLALLCFANPGSRRPAVAVKQVRVSDLSGRQAAEDAFAKLIVHEHPHYQGPITLDVLPDEIGGLPESEQYVSIEVIQPGERSGQRAVLSVDRFNQLATGGDMHTPSCSTPSPTGSHNAQPSHAGGTAAPEMAELRAGGRWSGGCRTGAGSRPRKPPMCGSILTRCRSCGPNAGCRCWIQPTPRPSSATACSHQPERSVMQK